MTTPTTTAREPNEGESTSKATKKRKNDGENAYANKNANSNKNANANSNSNHEQQPNTIDSNSNSNSNNSINPNTNPKLNPKRTKRAICPRCHRPTPRTCLCHALPETPIKLCNTEILVLQHPLELKNHKAASHRSVPLLELCLDSNSNNSKSKSNTSSNNCSGKSLELAVGRRLGDTSVSKEALAKINDRPSEYLPVLVFPRVGGVAGEEEDNVKIYNLRELVEKLKLENHVDNHNHNGNYNGNGNGNVNYNYNYNYNYNASRTAKTLEDSTETQTPTPTRTSPNRKPTVRDRGAVHRKILLLVLDATWKHAREMHLANIRERQYPPHMLRLALDKDDLLLEGGHPGFRSGRFVIRGKASKKGYQQKKFKQNNHNAVDTNNNNTNTNTNTNTNNSIHRADPPIDESWMSTAECIAWIVSRLEALSLEGGPKPQPSWTSPSPSSLYEILMKPLDAMAHQWQSFLDEAAASKKAASKRKEGP